MLHVNGKFNKIITDVQIIRLSKCNGRPLMIVVTLYNVFKSLSNYKKSCMKIS